MLLLWLLVNSIFWLGSHRLSNILIMRAFFSRTLKEKLQRHAMCNHLLIKDTIFAATSKVMSNLEVIYIYIVYYTLSLAFQICSCMACAGKKVMLTHFHSQWWQSGSGHIISGNASVGPDPGRVPILEPADTAKPGLCLHLQKISGSLSFIIRILLLGVRWMVFGTLKKL